MNIRGFVPLCPKPAKLAGKQVGKPKRVTCEAKLANGGRCARKSEIDRRRCRYHGGMATGPRTTEGKARVALNLPRCRAAMVRKSQTDD